MGVLPDCPTQGNSSKGSSKGFTETKAPDGTYVRTSVDAYSGVNKILKETPDGTSTYIYSYTVNPDKVISTDIILKNPGGADKTRIFEYSGQPPSAQLYGNGTYIMVPLEKKPDGYYGKQEDGTKITFYRDTVSDKPSTGNWVTETKAIDGKVITVYRNNDRSFNISTRNPDGTNSTAIEKSDGSGVMKDSRGITKTTNSDGTWFITYPKSPDGSTKIYYSDGRTVIQKPDG